MAYYCKSCKDDGPCDMHCAHCGTDVFNPNVETFTVERALRPEDSEHPL